MHTVIQKRLFKIVKIGFLTHHPPLQGNQKVQDRLVQVVSGLEFI